MDKLVIEGGKPLSGSIRIHGAKNAALPIMAASLLADGEVTLHNVPHLLDIEVMLYILERLGCTCRHEQGTVTINTSSIQSYDVPEELMKQMRSSIFLMDHCSLNSGKYPCISLVAVRLENVRLIFTSGAWKRSEPQSRNRINRSSVVVVRWLERIFIWISRVWEPRRIL